MKRFKQIALEKKHKEQIDFIASRLGQKKSKIMGLLIENLFDVFTEFRKDSCMMFYTTSRGKVIINVVGSSIVETGTRAPSQEEQALEKDAKPLIKTVGKIEERTQVKGVVNE